MYLTKNRSNAKELNTNRVKETSFKKLNKDGFSLIELIVVIVIIGILSFLATSSYESIFSKAERQGAIFHLHSYYAAQKVYQSEEGGFYNEFVTGVAKNHFYILGFAPEGELLYRIGLKDYDTKAYCAHSVNDCREDSKLKSNTTLTFSGKVDCPTCDSGGASCCKTFQASAKRGKEEVKINQKKEISTLIDGKKQ